MAEPTPEVPPGQDADSDREYWQRVCAAMPPMTPDEIADVATVLRRIDARRSHEDN